MKIVLIVPPYNVIIERLGLPHPLGLCYLGTVLKKRGYDIRIIDCDAMRINFKKLKDILLDERPHIVGVTSTTQMRFSAIKCINIVKDIIPNTYIVVGGSHFTATSEDALRVVDNLGFVVRGEGENTILDLVTTIENKGDFNKVDGLSFKEDGKIIHTKNRQPITNLDEIPMLDRDLVKNGIYFERLPHSNISCKSILSSRGCPFGCTFCFPHDRNYRRRSIGNILDEVEYLLNRFDVKAIRFYDLTFTLREENIINLCDEIKRRKLKFLWYCQSRVDINLKLLELMKETGLYSLDFGVESASKKVLNAIKKKIDLQQVLSFVKKCKELDIKTKVFLMMSLPEERIEDAEETFRFANELSRSATNLGISVTQIIPGTEVEKRAKELNILPLDFSWNSKYKSNKSRIFTGEATVPIYIEKLPLKYLIRLYQRYSILEIYSKERGRLKFFLRKIWRGLTNWDKGFIFKLKWLISLLRYRYS